MAAWFKSNWRWLLPSLSVTGAIILLFSYTLHLQNERHRDGYDIDIKDGNHKAGSSKSDSPEHPPKQHPLTKAKAVKNALPKVSQKKSRPESRQPIQEPRHKKTKPVPAIAMVPPQPVSLTTKRLSPDEIIENLEGLSAENRKREEHKLLGLHVDWVLHLFSATKKGDDKFTVTFDSAKNGFGVVLVADIDVLKYINIFAANQGDRIRILGTITAIDTNGTGRITLNADSVELAH